MRPYQRVTPPRFQAEAFNCAHCGAYAQQVWMQPEILVPNGRHRPLLGYRFSMCVACQRSSLWYSRIAQEGKYLESGFEIVYPTGVIGPEPHSDMPEKAMQLFLEASAVLRISPRAAAALGRLCLEFLCDELGAKGAKFVDKIDSLIVENRLDSATQELFEIVRNYGNDAIHPSGEIIILDDDNDAVAVLELVNALVDRLITQPERNKGLLERIDPRKRRAPIDHPDL